MMRKLIYILLIQGLSISICAQNKQQIFEKNVINLFQELNIIGEFEISKDTLYNTTMGEKFNISLSDDYIEFDTLQITLKSPYFNNKKNKAKKRKYQIKSYPKSFSVIYENSLISLFENGKFTSYHLDNLERNTNLENKLNTKKFEYHWIINEQLAGISGKTIYLWDDKEWIKAKNYFPLKSKPKLFEDNEFIVHMDCHGEFGGTVYFFEKKTAKTYFTESTCANSVIKNKDSYEVLAHLGHGMGSSEIKIIKDPRKLTLANEEEINTRINGEALGYKDKSNAYEKKLDFYGVQIFSSFQYQDRRLFIVNLGLTFIAEINDNEIEIVNPLFSNDMYTHDPITSKYGKFVLINLDFYGTAREREVSLILIENHRIRKLNWN